MKQLIIFIRDMILSLFKGVTVKPQDNKVICVYTEVKGKEAHGYMYFKDLKIPFISGRWGKGYAPKGLYKAYHLLNETRDAFIQHGLGWQVPMEAMFKTDRTGLAIHPDGNIKGTLGCIGLQLTSLDQNVRIKNTFRDYFEFANYLEVEIA